MILGSGALGVRPLSDPIALPPLFPSVPPPYPYKYMGAIMLDPVIGARLLPAAYTGASVQGAVVGVTQA